MIRTPVESSNIKELAWDKIDEFKGKLEVTFHSSGVYRYGPMPREVHEEFIKADSKGKYFHKYIKNNYMGEKVESDYSARRLKEILPTRHEDGKELFTKAVLQREAAKWINIYAEDSERNKCCRDAVRSWIKYFFLD